MTLSNLFSETFTIINQVPQSQTIASAVAWKKTYLEQCDRRDGIFDKTTGTMVYKANSWTVYCKDVERYLPPNWIKGYYTIPDDKKHDYYTADVGDLIIFGKIEDVEPTTIQEFQKLVTKYKDMGGLITNVQPYINYKPDGTPWRTNHIEMIRG